MPWWLPAFAPALWVAQIHPNPFFDHVTVDLNTTKADLFHIALMDLQGKIIKSSTNYFETGQHSIKVEGQDLASGMYFLKVATKDFQQAQKIIKSK